jgi:hypothetical protein
MNSPFSKCFKPTIDAKEMRKSARRSASSSRTVKSRGLSVSVKDPLPPKKSKQARTEIKAEPSGAVGPPPRKP